MDEWTNGTTEKLNNNPFANNVRWQKHKNTHTLF